MQLLGTVAELEEVALLINQTWPAEISISMLRALRKAGNFVGGAYREGRLVGACVGFFGHAGLDEMHSHLVVIAPEHRATGVGSALKLYQRAWAIGRGIQRISWTFDPLERRNAYVNLTKLSARPVEYLENFYGDHGDGARTRFPTDRLWLVWELQAARVGAAAREPTSPPDLSALTTVGCATLLDADRHGAPREGPDHGEPIALIGTPEHAASLRTLEPGVALAWRLSLRRQLGDALRAGGQVTGFAREGFYVVQREPS